MPSREEAGQWVPVTLGLGLPLSPDKLCIAVCGRAAASNFLDVNAPVSTAGLCMGVDACVFSAPITWPRLCGQAETL